jgi:hypothetical protein
MEGSLDDAEESADRTREEKVDFDLNDVKEV